MRRLLVIVTAAACGPAYKMTPGPPPYVDSYRWFRAPDVCGVGPYEIALDLEPVKHGEGVSLLIATPRRRVALDAAIVVDGTEVARAANTYDSGGINIGRPDNRRCIAPVEPGDVAESEPPAEPPPEPPATAALVEVTQSEKPPLSAVVVHHQLGERVSPTHVVLRVWSDEPNDLDGVRFGAMQREWNITPVD